jgi:hypothetical protein
MTGGQEIPSAVAGAGAVFPSKQTKSRLASLAAACLACFFLPPSHAQAPAAAAAEPSAIPADLPPGAQDVVKLTQAGLNEDVIVAQVRSAGHIYRLTADQIIELTNAGVSQNVIKTLIGGADSAAPKDATASLGSAASTSAPKPSAAPASSPSLPAPLSPPAASSATPATTPPYPVPGAPGAAAVEEAGPGGPPAAPVNLATFQGELSAYGMWIQTAQYGTVWVPSVATGNPSWQPYCDGGHWIYTDMGWYWNSQYPWGGIAFHYGRWTRLEGSGWAWVPDYTWGPSWVCWRHDEADGLFGWAPLPPGARFVAGQGLFFNGRVAADIDFGLRANDFVFCAYGHLLDRNFRPYIVPRERVAAIFRRSVVSNRYTVVNGRMGVEGLGRERMSVLTHNDLRPVPVRPAPVARPYAERKEEPVRREVRPGQ